MNRHAEEEGNTGQAITALTVAELGESAYSNSHPLAVALREELR
jgi:hypothetical protein